MDKTDPARDREHERIGHPPDDLRVGLEIVDRVLVVRSVNDRRCRRRRRRSRRRQALSESGRPIQRGDCAAMVDSMGEGRIDNSAASCGAGRHIYVHIPFCARICPYCAFYKERADPAQAARFCEAILAELRAVAPDAPGVDASLCEAPEKTRSLNKSAGVSSRASQREASTGPYPEKT